MNVSQCLKSLVIVLGVSVLSTGSVMAQASAQEPSLEQTVDWLLKNLPHTANYRVTWGVPGTNVNPSSTEEVMYSSIGFKDCTLSFSVGKPQDEELSVISSDLTMLDPANVRDISFDEALQRRYGRIQGTTIFS
jgi:hypothetical protein